MSYTLDLAARARGALLGLAAGDAVGTTVEFKRPGSFTPLTDMVGGGPFGLPVGAWTDDTSMALCLAESLVEQRSFDPADQMRRYVRWWREGHLSSTGTCFDIGTTVRQALQAFCDTAEPYSGSTDPRSAGNGSLMRLAPIALAYHAVPEVLERAADSSRTTHAARTAVDACRYYAGLIVGALRGEARETLLVACYEPFPGAWDLDPLCPEIRAIADGSFKHRHPPDIRGTGYVVHSLEAALWAFYHHDDFRSGALAAANLGDDADTTAAIYGQLAGAYYGAEGIPAAWREQLVMRAYFDRLASGLLELSRAVPAPD